MQYCYPLSQFVLLIWICFPEKVDIKSMSCTKLLRAIIMGPPGSGKGTIANRIVKDFWLTHLASGDMLRENMRHGTDIGVQAKSFIDKGELVPDKIMMELVLKELSNTKDRSWLLDGFPRTVPQAESLMEKHRVDIVVNLDVPFNEIINRVKDRYIHAPSGRIYNLLFNPPKQAGLDDVTGEPLVQRDDDKPETVRERLSTYQLKTEPVLHYFKNRGILANFPTTSSNEVWPKVHEEISKHCKPLQYTEY